MKKVPLDAPFCEETETVQILEDPRIVGPYRAVKESKEITCAIGDLKMPVVLAQTVKIIERYHSGVSQNTIINMLLAKIANMLTSKRIKYLEGARMGYSNYYATIFMPSGAGKDRISKDLDNFVFYLFKLWFKYEVEDLKNKQKSELMHEAKCKYPDKTQEHQREKYVKDGMKEFRNMIMEVSDGTREGLYCDAKAFKQADFGSLMIKIAELGQYLKNMTTEQKLFFNVLFEAYDAIIRSKCIKGERREEDIEDLPVNALLYSDPTLFKSNLEKEFNALLEAGMARRTIITFMAKKEPYKMQEDAHKAYKEEQKYYSDLKAIGIKLNKIFEAIEQNSLYELTQETYVNVFYPYKLKLEKLANNEENSLFSKEIMSRELKALRISCTYASLNHPTEFFIHPEDMEMAIDTVEKLSFDFRKFLTYRPRYEDRYDKIFQFFVENLDTKFSKTELVTKHFKNFRCSRDKFRKTFEDDMQIVSEIAQSNGYQLFCESINHNSGNTYWLSVAKLEELSDETIELNDLI